MKTLRLFEPQNHPLVENWDAGQLLDSGMQASGKGCVRFVRLLMKRRAYPHSKARWTEAEESGPLRRLPLSDDADRNDLGVGFLGQQADARLKGLQLASQGALAFREHEHVVAMVERFSGMSKTAPQARAGGKREHIEQRGHQECLRGSEPAQRSRADSRSVTSLLPGLQQLGGHGENERVYRND